MKPVKPVFLKTYGRERRKVSAWISPDNRKQAFDSTRSTDGDTSVYEPAKPQRKTREKRTCAVGGRAGRAAKKKAMLGLAEKNYDEEDTCAVGGRAGRAAKKKAMLGLAEKNYDEEDTSSFSPPPVQQSKTTRVRKTSVAVRPAKRKAMSCLTDSSSDEENIRRPSPPGPQPAQQSKTTSFHLPSEGRFVTRRRRAAATKPKLPKATFSTLNSSDDFSSGKSRILRPARKRVAPAFVLSSAENSMNVAGTASFATNCFREISLNELIDHSLGHCSRKPIFCSTPSAGSFSKRPRLKPSSINDLSSSPPSMSESCIGVLSTFQEDMDSLGKPVAAQSSAPPIELHSEEKPQSSLGEQEPDLHRHEDPSGDLFMEPKRSSCSEEAKSHSEDRTTENVGDVPSVNLLSKDDSESSSRFVSAAGGLEWLIEALKEKCLTERCTVQLERVDNLTVSELCSQTTYSSCLGHSSSAHSRQTDDHLSQSSETSFHLHLSVTDIKTSDYLQSVNSFESSEHAASVTDNSPSAEHTQESMEQSASVLYAESTHHKDSSVEFIMETQLPASSSVQTRFAVAVKDESLTKKCTVQLKKMALLSDANSSENEHTCNIEDPEDLTCSGEITERMTASVRQSTNKSSPVAQTEEKAAVLTTMLKEKCLTDKSIVKIERVSLSQLKEILQLRDAKLKSPTDVSDSASDDQTQHGHQSESDTNHCNVSAVKVDMKRGRGSTSSEDKIASDKEGVKNKVPHKGKKASLAPKEKKRRSTSTDRPGTTRKACVSGLSVSRWKNKSSASTHMFRSRTKAVNCSIDELISKQHKQPRELLGTTVNFSTPVSASRLNLSSLLADFTPNTHTWSRLKATLSVHRKNRVLHTLSASRLSASGSPVRSQLADISRDLSATPYRTPLPKRLPSRLLSRDSPSQVVCKEDADLSDEEKVCAECGQLRPLPWEECILPQRMKRCVKIGEGTFGEVFSTTNSSGDTVALKIIPVEGSEKVNGEDQKTFGEILHEIIISKELSSLKEKQQNKTHGFIGLNDLHCVQGCYPPDFLNAWDTFDQQKSSENDRPEFFEKDQLFIILEFEFGGVDLENSNGTLMSLGVAKSILHQVTAALAVAEQELHFEHRDLHWGNVLVKTTKQKTGSFLLNGAAHSLETKGVLVRIIDYSLSRLEIDDLTVSCDISEDEELFMGQGDYQFEIYRLMRQENGNNWSNYHPHTNVLWLRYLCSKLLSMKYRGSGGRGAKGMREELTRFYDNVLQYSSATGALQNCPMFQ